SQYGTIWAGNLFVMSTQAADGGDVLPGGGRLVIADAKTLKRIGSLDVLSYDGKSGDGRAIAGATPDKVYAGTSNGIYIVDIKDPAAPVVVGRIGLSDNNDLYSGQIGDMITAGRHVFAVMQANGLIIIDVDTDETSVISDSNVQGVTQTADGKVWYCTTGKDDAGANCSVFVALDPETLEEVDRVKMPASIGTVACGWGAWRSTAFKGAVDGNDIWFVTGAAGIMGGATGDYYRYTVGEDPEGIEPFFSLTGVMGETGFGEEVGQMTYGTPCFDARNNHLVVMAGRKNAASGGYRDHWIHFVDGDSHEITETFKLNPYYWFQSLPIFPDKYAPEIEADDFVFIVGDEAEKRELSVTDKDNIDNNIILTVEPSEYSTVAEVFLDGRMLSVTPLSVGKAYFTLMAQSNGKIASKTVAVEVKDKPVGIDDVNTVEGSVSCNGKDVVFRDFSGENFALYDMAGHFITDIAVDTDVFVARLGYPAGVYVLRSANGVTAKIVLN
ncbi:MAG: DUF5074 domain-containing protein, partial [Muribaculaceae bacterium]|nr:DUF5074 domain-containing protein [Muribaculaceae bacterium]